MAAMLGELLQSALLLDGNRWPISGYKRSSEGTLLAESSETASIPMRLT
jgi:hypothetical protein